MLKNKITCKIAREAYVQADYLKSLICYYEIAELIGIKTFQFNAWLCLKKILKKENEYHFLADMSYEEYKKIQPIECYVKDNVIISLTSYPARISKIYPTLKSLLNQNLKPKMVILWLANEEFPDGQKALPKDLQDLQNRGLLIKWTENTKSYKKLLPALKEFSESIIVTADDDVIYHKTWLLELFLTHISSPKNIIAHRIHRLKTTDNGTIDNYKKWDHDINSTIASERNFFTGCGGVLYPKKVFYKDILDLDKIKKIAPHADDIWFWAMGLLNGRKTLKVCFSNFQLDLTPDTQEDALWRENVTNNGNDEAMSRLVMAYPKIIEIIHVKREQTSFNKPLVSVIVPVFNTNPTYLKECLNSLVSQTFKDLEILCINDGSTDKNTLMILDQYSCKYHNIKLINKSNSGPASSRNYGILRSKGEYIAFVDSDDYVNDEFIESMYSSASLCKSNVTIATQVICFDEIGNTSLKATGFENYDKISKNQLISESINSSGMSCNKLYNKKYLLTNRLFYMNGMHCPSEDNYFTIPALILSLNSNSIAKNSYYYYRQHESSITKKISFDNMKDSMVVYESIKKRIEELRLSDKNYWLNVVNNRAIKDIKYNSTFCEQKKEIQALLYKKFKSRVDICCIADGDYLVPTMVFLQSLKNTKARSSNINVTVLVPSGIKAVFQVLHNLEVDDFSLNIREIEPAQFSGLHKSSVDGFCMASPSAMFKFIIPDIFRDLDRIIYIDSDLIVRKDLQELYMTPMDNEYLSAVTDMWTPVTDREEVKRFPRYFNSGMMVMNLSLMRAEGVAKLLIQEKERSTNFSLMDQDVFNNVCYERTKFLDIKYNFLPICYKRHSKRLKIDQINELYNSSYNSIEAIASDPIVVHWAGSDKPWKSKETLFADEWNSIYNFLQTSKLLQPLN